MTIASMPPRRWGTDMAIATGICGLEEAAIAEYHEVERRRADEVSLREITEAGRLEIKTEQLFRTIFHLNVSAAGGFVSTGHHTYAARMTWVDGFGRYRLCLIEICRQCSAEVATPFEDRASLGRLLEERGTSEPRCKKQDACWRRVGQEATWR